VDEDVASAVHDDIVSVVDEDTLEAARRLHARGLKPMVLNLADECFPGGHVDAGSGAQEESIFRCTDICATLSLATLPRGTYPLRPEEAMVTRGVSIVKASEARRWAALTGADAVVVDVISCPGLKHPTCDAAGRLSPEQTETLRRKADLVFQTAATNGNNAVVMGAMGCGAWRSPPEHVADILIDVAARWAPAFRAITFAVLVGAGDGYILADHEREGRPDNHTVFSHALRAHYDA
jgi:hypothetical protein